MTRFPGEERAMQLHVWGATDTGRMRSENQDAFLILQLNGDGTDHGFVLGPDSVAPPAVPSATHGDPQPQDHGMGRVQVGPLGFLLLVADGMGGAAGGRVASRLATSVIAGTLVRDLAKERIPSPARFAEHLASAVRQANAGVLDRARIRPDLSGMGTTATVAGILDGFVYIAQVGDSRAYLIRNGKATQITRDQSMVQELVDQGAMTREEAERSAHRSVLLQALGTEPDVRVPLTFHRLRDGDRLLLCSDGLSGPVAHGALESMATASPTPAEACRRLIHAANEAGGPDNITVVIADVTSGGAMGPADEVRLRPFDPHDP
ncbi:MAG: serine/threonine-protein phosphatase [Gemmatimonadales bacterium]|nr:MAG: serine/threonine-protein phosphatase [Gemmatimonadales bacterium]